MSMHIRSRRLTTTWLAPFFILSSSSTLSSLVVTAAPSVRRPSIRERIEGGILAALCGDALALSGHYEYDARKIKDMVGRYTEFAEPGAGMGGSTNGVGWGTANYHPGKVAGDLTDAGDLNIMLLEHLVQEQSQGKPFSFDAFAGFWYDEITVRGYGSCNFMSVGREHQGPCPAGMRPGYINGGSRRTLEMLQARPGLKGEARKAAAADVNCLIAATHFLPLFLTHSASSMEEEETLVANAVSTVYLSHKNRDPVVAAAFLARALVNIVYKDMDLVSSLDAAAAVVNDSLINKWLADAKAKVVESTDPASPLFQVNTHTHTHAHTRL